MPDNDQTTAETGRKSARAAPAVIEAGGPFRIFPGERLPAFDAGQAVAVKAQDDRTPEDPFFARIAPLSAAPRFESLKTLKGVGDAHLLRPVEWKFLSTGPGGALSVAIVFAAPLSDPLMPAGAQEFEPLPPDVLNRNVLGSLCLALAQISQRGLTHRALFPGNLYWDGEHRNAIVLGDCVSQAPGSLLPAVFESTEAAMTPPLARGAGSIRDDFYALGTTILSLATGRIPMAGKSDQQIIEEKINRGSYSAMMDGERPPFGLRELLRGLLADNPDDRWGFEQIEQWLGGDQRVTVKETRTGVADRPYEFEGAAIKNCRLLAEAFGENAEKAANTIFDSGFHGWLQRGLPEASIANGVTNVLAIGFDSAKSKRRGARDVARVCTVLDRFGPLRFKNLKAMPTGLGALLLKSFLEDDGDTAALIAEAISSGVVNDWYEAQSNSDRVIYDKEIKEFQQVAQLIRHSGLGYGIERCLYMLNPRIPCLSPMLNGAIVSHVSDLLPELERLLEMNGGLETLVDSHLAAFIASRIKGNIDRQLMSLEAAEADPLRVKQGTLAIFAKVQEKHGPEELPALSQWFAQELEPLVERYDSQSTREKLRRKVKSLSASGDLVALYDCLEDERYRKADAMGRERAAQEFAAASREISKLESREFQETAQRLGWKIAVGISNTILATTVLTLIVVSY